MQVVTQTLSGKVAVCGFGPLVSSICANLKSSGFSVYEFDPSRAALPVLVAPDFLLQVMTFNNWTTQLEYLRENLQTVKIKNPKIIIFGENLTDQQKSQIEIVLANFNLQAQKYNFTSSQTSDSLSSIVDDLGNPSASTSWAQLKFNFGTNQQNVTFNPQSPDLIDLPTPPKVVHKKTINPKIKFVFLSLVIFITLVIGSVLSVVLPLILGINDLEFVKSNLSISKTVQVREKLNSAYDYFNFGQNNLIKLSPVLIFLGQKDNVLQIDNLFSLAKITTEAGNSAVSTLPTLQKVVEGISDPLSPTYSVGAVTGLKPDLEKLNLKLGQAQTKLDAINPTWRQKVIPEKYKFFQNTINDSRALIFGVSSLIDNYDSIFGMETPKKYLIVLQNPAELRATGGFIGSFALVSFDQGKIVGFKLYDIYDADGQLRGKISPPDEILHFLGQPNWYMRDGNWAADFPLTAKRLIWFLEKEIGDKADGVVAVDVHAVEKLLLITGPVKLADYDETVDSTNLFQKAEFRSEINFFPGSTQKKDYLNSVLTAIVNKASSGSLDSPGLISSAIASAFKEKNIMLYSNDSTVQTSFVNNGWAGEIHPKYCDNGQNPCFSVIESNLGANKSNYYVKRKIDLVADIGKTGAVNYRLKIKLDNNSPNNTWPGGDYKNYLRLLLPVGSQISEFNQFDGRTMNLSPTLTAKTIAETKINQFLVHQTTESQFSSFGTLITVPTQASKEILVSFAPNQQIDLQSSVPTLNLNWIKQPGTLADEFNVTINFPAFLKPIKQVGSELFVEMDQKIVYNSVLNADKNISVGFELNR